MTCNVFGGTLNPAQLNSTPTNDAEHYARPPTYHMAMTSISATVLKWTARRLQQLLAA